MTQIEKLKNEYAMDNDPFSEEPQTVRVIKSIIFNDLDEAERRIILLYADKASMREVAKELNVSPASAYNYISKIRNKIRQYLK